MLAYDEQGRGEPLVLIHGLAASKEIWHGARPLLANHRTIAVDVPGFGDSAPIADDFELRDVAQAIWDGLPSELGPVSLVGHSMGGAVALMAAVLAPERVKALVLCAPAGLLPVPVPEALLGPAGLAWDAAVQVRRRLEPLAAWPLGRRILLGTSTAPGETLTEDDVRAIIRGTAGARSIGAALRTVARADLRDELAALPMPVGLLWGTDDNVVPRRALDAGVAARPDLEIGIVDGAGHLPMLERPSAFVGTLEEMLARLIARGEASPPGET